MRGPLLPGEHAPSVRAIPSPLPSQASLPLIASPALSDLARLAYWQGVNDAEMSDCDSDPFS
jgi:hypothetical protein